MVVNLLSLVLCLSISSPVESDDGQGSSVEKARDALGPLDKEFDAARARLDAQLVDLSESDAYKEAREARDYEKARTMMEIITTPFYERWRERYREACAPYVGSEGEIAFAGSMLNRRLAEDPGALVGRLVKAHVKSRHLLPLAKSLWRVGSALPKEEHQALLQRVIDENPVVEIQAYGYYARGGRPPCRRGRKGLEGCVALIGRGQPVADFIEDVSGSGS